MWRRQAIWFRFGILLLFLCCRILGIYRFVVSFFSLLEFFDERVENVSFSEAEPKFKVNGITFEFQKFGGGRGGI